MIVDVVLCVWFEPFPQKHVMRISFSPPRPLLFVRQQLEPLLAIRHQKQKLIVSNCILFFKSFPSALKF